jgi:hypothetical protein
MKPRDSTTAFVLTVVIAVLGAGAIAVAAGRATDAAPGDQGPPPDRATFTQGPRAMTVPRELSDRFVVLRRGRTARDELPAEMAARMEAHPTWDFGANPRLARRASAAHGGLFVVPGSGGVCLLAGEGSGTCNMTEAAQRGEVLGTTTGIAHGYEEGEYRVSGIAADDVDQVVLHMSDGRSFDLQVTGNVYTLDVKGEPASVTWDGADGHHELAVPH